MYLRRKFAIQSSPPQTYLAWNQIGANDDDDGDLMVSAAMFIEFDQHAPLSKA